MNMQEAKGAQEVVVIGPRGKRKTISKYLAGQGKAMQSQGYAPVGQVYAPVPVAPHQEEVEVDEMEEHAEGRPVARRGRPRKDQPNADQ